MFPDFWNFSKTQLVCDFPFCRCLLFYQTFLVQSHSIYLINYDSFACIFARSSTTALYELDLFPLSARWICANEIDIIPNLNTSRWQRSKITFTNRGFNLPDPHSSYTRRRITRICSNVQVQLEPAHAALRSAGTCLRGFVRSDLVAPCFLSQPTMPVTSSGNTSKRRANVGSRSQRVVLSNVLTQCLHAIPARAVLPVWSLNSPIDLPLHNCRRSDLRLPSQGWKRRSQAVCCDVRRSASRSATALHTSPAKVWSKVVCVQPTNG